MAEQRAIQLGVIGLGAISKYYLAAISELSAFRLTAVCDTESQKLAPFAGAGVATSTDATSILAMPDVDAVIVNVPNDAHFEICIRALNAGKHVCCEKPLALTGEHARALRAAAKQNGVTLFTAFHRRYNTNIVKLCSKVDPTRIRHVRIRYFERIEDHTQSDGWYLDPTRCGGGALADNGPNVLDLLAMLMGPLEIARVDVVRDDHGVDRQATLVVRGKWAWGIADLDWSYGSGELKDLLLMQDDGTVASCDMLSGFPGFKSSLYHEYVGVLEAFQGDLLGGRSGQQTGPDGVVATELIERAYQAAFAER
jgi:predicted dehydrogenase